jgi:hypothetical protein
MNNKNKLSKQITVLENRKCNANFADTLLPSLMEEKELKEVLGGIELQNPNFKCLDFSCGLDFVTYPCAGFFDCPKEFSCTGVKI